MNTLKHFRSIFFIVVLISVYACSSDDSDIDTEKPTVDLTIADAFPISCDTIYFGQPFTVKMLFNDNIELGSFNIDIHHNFDQHTHSTEFEQCEFDLVKTPVNPYVFIQDYSIPLGSSEYTADIPLILPTGNGTSLYDEGDYHFQVTVIDKEGWSILKGLNVKILHP